MVRFTRLRPAPLSQREHDGALHLALDWDQRTKSRLALMSRGGEAIAVLLPRGTVLRGGAVLESDDGRLAQVEASPQRLLRIEAPPALLLRVVYHLANRHVPAQLAVDHVLIEDDPVLGALAMRLGASVEAIEAPFEPEAGAYLGDGAGHRHGPADDEHDAVSATIGEQLSIDAHARRQHGRLR